LESVGSFFVGGHSVSRTTTEVGLYDGGSIELDQMYVQFMVPQRHPNPPIVMVHGGALSGKSFETTPDGRMGWYEYFVRKGFPTYVVDQVGRARSGFDPAPFNSVRAGTASPSTQPAVRRVSTERAAVRFRIGPEGGTTFADSQFPASAVTELAKQTVPDLDGAGATDDASVKALADLSGQLSGVILLGHSQAGPYPIDAALRDRSVVRAIIAVEPPGCKATTYSDAQIAKLSKTPVLIVFGDHIDAPQRIGVVQWTDALSDCRKFAERLKASGGNVTLFHLPELGIRGNSHMMMQDRNNLQIADLIIGWIRREVR